MRGSPPLAPPLCVCGEIYLTLPYLTNVAAKGAAGSVDSPVGRPQGGLGPPPRRHLLALTRGALLRDMARYGGTVGVGDGSGYCGGMGGALLRRLSRQRLRPRVGGRSLRLVAPRLGRLGGLEAGSEPRPLLVRHGYGCKQRARACHECLAGGRGLQLGTLSGRRQPPHLPISPHISQTVAEYVFSSAGQSTKSLRPASSRLLLEIWGDKGRYGETLASSRLLPRDMARYGEMWGDVSV